MTTQNLLPKQLFWAATTARKETFAFARKHRSIGNHKNLLGYCAIGSYLLQKIAATKNLKLDFHIGTYSSIHPHPCEIGYEDHCWCVYNKSTIVDITASQFYTMVSHLNGDGVFIADQNYAALHKRYYNACQGHSNSAALKEVNQYWLREQRPNEYQECLDRVIKKYATSKHKQVPQMESSLVC